MYVGHAPLPRHSGMPGGSSSLGNTAKAKTIRRAVGRQELYCSAVADRVCGALVLAVSCHVVMRGYCAIDNAELETFSRWCSRLRSGSVEPRSTHSLASSCSPTLNLKPSPHSTRQGTQPKPPWTPPPPSRQPPKGGREHANCMLEARGVGGRLQAGSMEGNNTTLS